MFVDLVNPTVGDLIKELSKYPDDAQLIFEAERKGYFTDIYPLCGAYSERGYQTGIYEGSYQNSVCITLKG